MPPCLLAPPHSGCPGHLAQARFVRYMNVPFLFISLALAIRPVTTAAIAAADEVGIKKTGFPSSGPAWQIASKVAVSALASVGTPVRRFMRLAAGQCITPMGNATQVKASAQHREAMHGSEAPHGSET